MCYCEICACQIYQTKREQRFDKDFEGIKSVFAERLASYNAKREDEKNVQQWAARVRSLAARCSFRGAMLDTVMKKFIIP